jgi:hypothetical protein
MFIIVKKLGLFDHIYLLLSGTFDLTPFMLYSIITDKNTKYGYLQDEIETY